MSLRPSAAWPLALLLSACAAGRSAPPPAPAAPGAAIARVAPGTAEAEARAADQAFSAAAVAHDAAAFAHLVAADAVFVGPRGVQAGAAAVCNDWAPLLARGGPTLAWAPDAARSSGAGDLVMTRGSYTFTPANGGPASTGRYVTVWRREGDGKLRAMFDGPDRPLPPEAAAATRRPLRRVLSDDDTLGAAAGLLLAGEREVGEFLLVEAREGDTWRVLVEVGSWRPDAR